MTSMFQNSPSLKFFWLAAILYSGQSNFEFECLGEFVTEFENVLGYELGIHRLNLERLNLEWDFYPNGLNPEWDST